MRVLHVVSSLNVGGAERFVIDLARQQKKALSLDVGVISMGKAGEPLENEIKTANISLFFAISIRDIRKVIKHYDVIHIQSSHCLLRVMLASLGLPIKLVYTRHNEVVHQGLKWQGIYFLANLLLNKMLFVAEKAKSNYLNKYPQYKSKAQTILNGVLPIEKNIERTSVFRLGHVGRFVPLKSQHVLIKAVAELPIEIQPNIEISFFGTGELMGKNQAMAKSLIPNTKTIFHGFETNRDVIYQSFDALIVTSETEGLSLAILEAFASGTPVIASNVGGNPELVKDKENGFLYEYADAKALAKAIEKLMDETTYKVFSEKSRQRYFDEFSMEICALEYLKSYQ